MTSSNANIFCVTGSLCGEFIGHRWIPRLWCFLWCTFPWLTKDQTYRPLMLFLFEQVVANSRVGIDLWCPNAHVANTESCRNWSITIMVKLEWMSSMLRVTLQWDIVCATFVSWWHWTYKVPVRLYFVECVSKIKHIFSVIHYTIYGAVCFQFTHFPWDDWENIHFVLLS